ncbi:MAG: hypothetical protein ABIQ77_07640 [Anaerolineales bacterium]
MTEVIRLGDRVKVLLGSDFWQSEGWFEGIVRRIDPYSEHRSFYWVELDETVSANLGAATKFISVLNPKNIHKI